MFYDGGIGTRSRSVISVLSVELVVEDAEEKPVLKSSWALRWPDDVRLAPRLALKLEWRLETREVVRSGRIWESCIDGMDSCFSSAWVGVGVMSTLIDSDLGVWRSVGVYCAVSTRVRESVSSLGETSMAVGTA